MIYEIASSKAEPPGKNRGHRRTGPRTPLGKSRSKRNAIKHGIFARIVLTEAPFQESAKEYLAMLKSLRDSLQPVNGLENLLVEKLWMAFVRLSRVYRADAEFSSNLFSRATRVLDKEHSPIVTESYLEKNDAAWLWRDQAPEHLLKYEITIERSIERTLEQLNFHGRKRSG